MQFGIKKAGGISFGVSMTTSQLGKDTKTARAMLGGFVNDTKKRLEGLKTSLTGVGTALTAAFSACAIANGIKTQFAYIDSLYDTAKSLGVTTDALSGLGYAAEQSGSSQDDVARALGRMVKSTRDASLGLETVSRAYTKLGIDAAALNKLSPEKQFATIADGIKGLKNQNDQLTATQDIFGRGATNLVETLRMGADGLREMRVEGEKLGVVIKNVEAAQIAKANDAFSRIQKAWQGLYNRGAVALAPTLELTEMIVNAGKTTNPITDIRLRTKEREGRHRLLLAEARKRFKDRNTVTLSEAGGALGAPLRDLAKNLLGTPKQILDGILNSPAAQMQRQLAFANLKNNLGPQMATDATWAKTRGVQQKSYSLRSFDALESGSLAAYQQRIRGQQQFEKARPIEKQQLDVQEDIRDGISTIADAMSGIVAEGSF